MTCQATILTEGGVTWRCPREAGDWGYCPVHIPRHLYRIKYTWPKDHKLPEGKVRYRTDAALTGSPQLASLYDFEEAEDIIRNRSRDAYLVWGIIATKEPVS